MVKVFLSLGSNLEEREKNIQKALEELKNNSINILKISANYETEPEGYIDQPKFINAAAEIETDLKPLDLLKTLKNIEKKLGRKDTFKWGPRIIDIDILTYGDISVQEKELTIPHPLLKTRKFVLEPLKEIAPDFVRDILK